MIEADLIELLKKWKHERPSLDALEENGNYFCAIDVVNLLKRYGCDVPLDLWTTGDDEADFYTFNGGE